MTLVCVRACVRVRACGQVQAVGGQARDDAQARPRERAQGRGGRARRRQARGTRHITYATGLSSSLSSPSLRRISPPPRPPSYHFRPPPPRHTSPYGMVRLLCCPQAASLLEKLETVYATLRAAAPISDALDGMRGIYHGSTLLAVGNATPRHATPPIPQSAPRTHRHVTESSASPTHPLGFMSPMRPRRAPEPAHLPWRVSCLVASESEHLSSRASRLVAWRLRWATRCTRRASRPPSPTARARRPTARATCRSW